MNEYGKQDLPSHVNSITTWRRNSTRRNGCSSANLIASAFNFQPAELVEEMKLASGLPMPRVFVIPDPDPNAFATGINPETGSLAVTQGLLNTLNREELQVVIADEISHIRNYDIRLMTVIASLPGAILLLADWSRRSMRMRRASSSKRKSNGGGGVGGVLCVDGFSQSYSRPTIGQLVARAVSRTREYLADASTSELTRNPLALVNALRKLERASAPTASVKRGSAHLCIVNPLGKMVNVKEGVFADRERDPCTESDGVPLWWDYDFCFRISRLTCFSSRRCSSAEMLKRSRS